MQKEISVERNELERTYTKYNKIIRTLSIVETMAGSGGISAGTVGIASIASVVASPVGFVLEGVATSLGVTATAIKYAKSKLNKKAKKNNEIRVLSESKLNTIGSQEEFVLISKERANYSEMKENIRTRFTRKNAPPDIKTIVDKEKKRSC